VSHGTKIAKRQVSPINATPALPGIGAMLDQYMWMHTISSTPFTDLLTGRRGELLRIEGFIKPDLAAPNVPSLRRGFLASLDAIIAILDEAGAMWQEHPAFIISGRVHTERDGSQSFTEIAARVDFTLLAGS
jgi:hypothetical protein